MYCLSTICIICLNKENRKLISTNSADTNLFHKLNSCSFVTSWIHSRTNVNICNQCYATLQLASEFINMCRKNSLELRGYFTQLKHTSASTHFKIEQIDLSDDSVDEVISQTEIKQEKEANCVTKKQHLSQVSLKTEFDADSLKKEAIHIDDAVEESLEQEKDGIEEENVLLEQNCTIKEEIITEHQIEYVNLKRELVSCIDVGSTDDYQPVVPANNVNHFIPSNIKCDICGSLFSCPSDLKKHRVIHIEEQNFACTICSEKCANMINLNEHMLIHIGEKKYQCTVCEKRFMQLSSLNVHMLIHTGEYKYQCTICRKLFIQSAGFKSHMLIHSGEKKFQCTVCEKRFKHSSTLYAHTQIHTGEKKFACTICDKRFILPARLKSHMLIHSGEKKYQCTVCEKRFAHDSNLKAHIPIHTGERKYKCTVCEKRFTHSSALISHMLIHTGEKRYHCNFCEKKFTYSSTLKSHMMIHTGGRKNQFTTFKNTND